MKIENETQAKAARKKLDALKEYAEAFGLPFSYGKFDTPPRIYNAYDSCSEEVQIRTALAAYESRDKVKEIAEGLSEGDRNILLVMTQDDGGGLLFTSGLAKKLMYCNAVADLQNLATPLAHEVAAYLRSQKRELKVGDKVKILAKPCRVSDYAELIGKIGEVSEIGDKSNNHVGEIRVGGYGLGYWFFKSDLAHA